MCAYAVAVPAFAYAAEIWFTGIHPSTSGKKRFGSVSIVTKLTPVQRRAAKAITGALNTTAGDALDAHANLLPIDLLYHKILSRTAIRLAPLPPSHPLHSPVKSAAKRYIGKHRSPLHSLFFITKTPQTLIETIHPTRRHPNYIPSFQPRIMRDKPLALDLSTLMHEVAGFSIYCDGSGFEGGFGASAILYADGQETN